MKYIIEGQPIPLQRPRFYNGNVFDCQKREKLFVGVNLRHIHGNRPLFEGPLEVHLTFYMKNQKKNGWHYGRPDLDNLIKFYLDAANGILYEDDKQIAKIVAEKIYDIDPRTEITIISCKTIDSYLNPNPCGSLCHG